MAKGFKIIGISTRTTNQNKQAQQDLGKLWKRFFTENIPDKIPNKASDEIWSIYTDYESDYSGEYTSIIGIPVTKLNEIPDGLIGREFLPEKFKKFTAKGDMPNAVAKTWMDIWQNDKELNRKYSYDYEVYGEKSRNAENSEVDIYIAVN